MNPETQNTTEKVQQEIQETEVITENVIKEEGKAQETKHTPNQEQAISNENRKQSDENQEPATANENQEVKEQQTETIENLHEKLQAELGEYKDKYLRLYADFENFRRRNAKEKADLVKYAGENVIKSMLTVLDDFERALKAMENNTEITPIKEGIQLVFQKFSKLLEQNGLKPIETQQGDNFDTEKHESITQIPAPTPELKGKVVEVVEKGYYLQDKVIRFAKVVVGS
ncbi:MAG: nucleotide exchange factor GrpE [Microscillaceae bacterium]|nr:nucleotide exchange factor GrpE [Microscillaceae bacterium]MDW8460947.1 nucleotide exchange factor GrpE [Cytophagales bacterium]